MAKKNLDTNYCIQTLDSAMEKLKSLQNLLTTKNKIHPGFIGQGTATCIAYEIEDVISVVNSIRSDIEKCTCRRK